MFKGLKGSGLAMAFLIGPQRPDGRLIKSDGYRDPRARGPLSAQAERGFPGPGPGCGLVRGQAPARARWPCWAGPSGLFWAGLDKIHSKFVKYFFRKFLLDISCIVLSLIYFSPT
jgi:hypothetical protein